MFDAARFRRVLVKNGHSGGLPRHLVRLDLGPSVRNVREPASADLSEPERSLGRLQLTAAVVKVGATVSPSSTVPEAEQAIDICGLKLLVECT